MVAYLGFLKIDANNMQVCMAVNPKRRRQRIGTNLFLRLVSEFDSFSYSVSLDPENETGKAFLETLGFNFASKEISMELFRCFFVAANHIYFDCFHHEYFEGEIPGMKSKQY